MAKSQLPGDAATLWDELIGGDFEISNQWKRENKYSLIISKHKVLC